MGLGVPAAPAGQQEQVLDRCGAGEQEAAVFGPEAQVAHGQERLRLHLQGQDSRRVAGGTEGALRLEAQVAPGQEILLIAEEWNIRAGEDCGAPIGREEAQDCWWQVKVRHHVCSVQWVYGCKRGQRGRGGWLVWVPSCVGGAPPERGWRVPPVARRGAQPRTPS